MKKLNKQLRQGAGSSFDPATVLHCKEQLHNYAEGIVALKQTPLSQQERRLLKKDLQTSEKTLESLFRQLALSKTPGTPRLPTKNSSPFSPIPPLLPIK